MLILGVARKPNTSPQTRDLLTIMLRKPLDWHYGYELSQEAGLSSGTLYPLLMRLSDQGLLDSHWQELERPGRPPRHVYRLTSEGLAFARTIIESRKPAAVGDKLAGATT